MKLTGRVSGFMTYYLLTTFRFCDAMIQIRREAQEIIDGKQPKDGNVLKNAPHPMSAVAVADAQWNRYARVSMAIEKLTQINISDHILVKLQPILYLGYLRRKCGRQCHE